MGTINGYASSKVEDFRWWRRIMNKFVMMDALLVGHSVIDTEHAGIIGIINDMVDAVQDRDLELCEAKWLQLQEAINQHFMNEEVIMADLYYVEKQHIQAHRKIVTDLDAIGKKCITIEDWGHCMENALHRIVDNILNHDLGFSKHLTGIKYKDY